MTQILKFFQMAHAEGLPLPAYATEGAAGFDFVAAEEATLLPGHRALVKTGLKAAVPAGYELQIRPRSGLALKHGITVLNTPGTVDSDYRGEIGVILHNAGKEPFLVNRGERIAQGVIAAYSRVAIEAAAGEGELGATQRGEGGFGSTGMRAGQAPQNSAQRSLLGRIACALGFHAWGDIARKSIPTSTTGAGAAQVAESLCNRPGCTADRRHVRILLHRHESRGWHRNAPFPRVSA